MPHPKKLSLLDGDDGSDSDRGAAVKLRVNEGFAKRLEVRVLESCVFSGLR